MRSSSLPLAAGLDGCRHGWVAALLEPGLGFTLRLLPTLADVEHLSPRPAMVGVDMPIGLLETSRPGGRECDRQARTLLGKRKASVFSPPSRPALAAKDYRQAMACNGQVGLSIQCYNLFPKLREADGFLTPARQERVREVHPELAFAQLAHGAPCRHAKKTAEGRTERLERLAAFGLSPKAMEAALAPESLRRLGAKPDDVLDALAAAVAARRILAGAALRVPQEPETDARGLRMEIWA